MGWILAAVTFLYGQRGKRADLSERLQASSIQGILRSLESKTDFRLMVSFGLGNTDADNEEITGILKSFLEEYQEKEH